MTYALRNMKLCFFVDAIIEYTRHRIQQIYAVYNMKYLPLYLANYMGSRCLVCDCVWSKYNALRHPVGQVLYIV